MSENTSHEAADPSWWVTPGETDYLAWFAIIFIAIAVYLLVSLYVKFDHWAEHKSEGTPLAKTIPTLLTIALLYEVFPLDHFSVLLPLTAILLAVMADWMAAQAKHDLVNVENTGALIHELETMHKPAEKEPSKAKPAVKKAKKAKPNPDVDDEVSTNEDGSDTKVNKK